MISKSELMCNDWVLVRQIGKIPFKVIGLREDSAELKPLEGMPFLAPYEDLEPIPLFSELCELNKIEPFNLYISVGEDNGELKDFKHVVGHIDSVHKIQNFFRLIGKVDTADGFKLPFKSNENKEI